MRLGWLLALAACKFTPGELGGGAPLDGMDATDDALADATSDAAWTVAMCPSEYTSYGTEPSRYRLNPAPANFWQHADDCANDLPGKTHLVAVGSVAEATAIMSVIENTSGLPSVGIYVLPFAGGLQLRGQSAPGAGWISVTGGTLFAGAWSTNEPRDGDGNENDAEDHFCFYRGQTYMADVAGTYNFAAVCECDGLPVAQAFTDELEATRP